MTEFRLTQISDTHLSRNFAKLTDNFDRVSEHVDANRPDLVINSGDVSWDGPTSRADLEFAGELHAALPVDCRYLPGNHDIGDNPTAVGVAPSCPATEERREAFVSILGEDRWQFDAANWRFIGLNSLIMNTGIPSEARTGRMADLAACGRQRKADRAVSAQAAISERTRRSGGSGYRDPLCSAARPRAIGGITRCL